MVNLSTEEPDAVMSARPDLREPWVVPTQGHPGPRRLENYAKSRR